MKRSLKSGTGHTEHTARKYYLAGACNKMMTFFRLFYTQWIMMHRVNSVSGNTLLLKVRKFRNPRLESSISSKKTNENTLHTSKNEFICSFFWKNSQIDNLISKLMDLYNCALCALCPVHPFIHHRLTLSILTKFWHKKCLL